MNMIFNIVFYRSYLFFNNQEHSRNSVSNANGVVTGFISLNIYTVLSFIKNYIMDFSINLLYLILLVIFITVLIGILFDKNKINRLSEKYSQYSKKKIFIMRFIVTLYYILSFFFFFLFLDNITA